MNSSAWHLQPCVSSPLSHRLMLALGGLACCAPTGACHSASHTASLSWLCPLSCLAHPNPTTFGQWWRLESLKHSWNLTACSRIHIFIWLESVFSNIYFCCFTSLFLSLRFYVSWLLYFLPHIWFSFPVFPWALKIGKTIHSNTMKHSRVSVKCSGFLDREYKKFLNLDQMLMIYLLQF